jgi:tetratricopeptide (TPR) repeat protein
MSTPTSEFLTNLAMPTATRRAGRPRRDERLEHLAGTTLAIEVLTQGAVGYAGDADDPRPVPARSLYDLKKELVDTLAAARLRSAFPEDTLFFAFCHDRVASPLEETVPVSRDALWWLAAPGDTLLVSDRRTHHYISVLRVDTDADRIQLLDPWPDRVMLKKGLNIAGVEAVVEPLANEATAGKTLVVTITRAEFLKVAVGLVTRDTPDLIDQYLADRPTERESGDTRLAFGLTLLDAEKYGLYRKAAEHFRAALRLAEAAHASERIDDAAARLFVALVGASHHQRWSGEALASRPFDDELRRLIVDHTEARLLAHARRIELCSIGNAAASSGDLVSARRYLDVAVARFPEEEEPRRLRGKVALAGQDYEAAAADLALAVDYNARRIRALEERRDAWHAHDSSSRSRDDGLIGGLKERRAEELELHARALTALGRGPEAAAAVQERRALEKS